MHPNSQSSHMFKHSCDVGSKATFSALQRQKQTCVATSDSACCVSTARILRWNLTSLSAEGARKYRVLVAGSREWRKIGGCDERKLANGERIEEIATARIPSRESYRSRHLKNSREEYQPSNRFTRSQLVWSSKVLSSSSKQSQTEIRGHGHGIADLTSTGVSGSGAQFRASQGCKAYLKVRDGRPSEAANLWHAHGPPWSSVKYPGLSFLDFKRVLIHAPALEPRSCKSVTHWCVEKPCTWTQAELEAETWRCVVNVGGGRKAESEMAHVKSRRNALSRGKYQFQTQLQGQGRI